MSARASLLFCVLACLLHLAAAASNDTCPIVKEILFHQGECSTVITDYTMVIDMDIPKTQGQVNFYHQMEYEFLEPMTNVSFRVAIGFHENNTYASNDGAGFIRVSGDGVAYHEAVEGGAPLTFLVVETAEYLEITAFFPAALNFSFELQYAIRGLLPYFITHVTDPQSHPRQALLSVIRADNEIDIWRFTVGVVLAYHKVPSSQAFGYQARIGELKTELLKNDQTKDSTVVIKSYNADLDRPTIPPNYSVSMLFGILPNRKNAAHLTMPAWQRRQLLTKVASWVLLAAFSLASLFPFMMTLWYSEPTVSADTDLTQLPAHMAAADITNLEVAALLRGTIERRDLHVAFMDGLVNGEIAVDVTRQAVRLKGESLLQAVLDGSEWTKCETVAARLSDPAVRAVVATEVEKASVRQGLRRQTRRDAWLCEWGLICLVAALQVTLCSVGITKDMLSYALETLHCDFFAPYMLSITGAGIAYAAMTHTGLITTRGQYFCSAMEKLPAKREATAEMRSSGTAEALTTLVTANAADLDDKLLADWVCAAERESGSSSRELEYLSGALR